MAKYLNEDNDNKYAKAIHEVEDAMNKNSVSIDYMGGFYIVTILDKRFRSVNVSSWPRMVDDEKLEVIE